MGLLYHINVEEGNFSDWTATGGAIQGSGYMFVQTGAALAGSTYGLGIMPDSMTAHYGYHTNINNTSGVLRYRYYIDPNSCTTNQAFTHMFLRLYSGSSDYIAESIIERKSSSFMIRNKAYRNNYQTIQSDEYITDEPHWFEILITRATSGSSNGEFVVIKDGTEILNTTIDNYLRFSKLHMCSFGSVGGSAIEPTIPYYLDEFVVRDDNVAIGPTYYVTPAISVAKADHVSPFTIQASLLISPSPTDASIIVVEPIIHEGSQLILASADSIDGQWTNEAGNNTNLYDSINEASYSDTDFIVSSSVLEEHETCRFKLASALDPGCEGGHIISLRFKKKAFTPYITNLIVRLLQGNTTIASTTYMDIGLTVTENSFTLTPAEASAITDYTDLYVEFEAYSG